MKWIVYNKENVVLNDDGEVENQSFIPIHAPYSAENEEIAKSEAYKGEYTIEDDGQPDPAPSTESILLELVADHEARLCEIELGV